MFGKLKDKLKSTLSIFSKKAETEADVVEAEVVEEVQEVAPEPSKDELLDLEADETDLDVEEHKVVESEKEEVVLQEIEKAEAESEIDELIEGSKKSEVTVEEKEEEKPEISKAELLDSEVDKTEVASSEDGTEAAKDVVEVVESAQESIVVSEVEKAVEKISEEKEELEKVEVEDKTIEPKQEAKKEIKEEPKEVVKEEKKSFFSKIKQKLTTKTINQEKFEELFWDLEVVLLESNVSVKVIERIKTDLSEELVDKPLPRDVSGKIQEVLAETLRDILSVESKDLLKEIAEFKEQGKPYTIIFFGINGSGKTTSIAKLAYLLKSKGLSVVMAAGDTFRAAAIDQLQDHANKIDVKLIKHDYGSDAAAVAYDARKYAEKNNVDVVLIDTAGRLHSNTNLMAELEKMMRVANPDCKIFIGESITGNDCVEQAEKYETTLGIDGIILTKADIDEMGGAPLSICYVTGKPILYLGMGQEYKDLMQFSADLILNKLGIEG